MFNLQVFEVYISWLNATVVTPKYQLVNFNRTMLDKGQTKSLSALITSDQMAVYIDGKGFVIEPGKSFSIEVTCCLVPLLL